MLMLAAFIVTIVVIVAIHEWGHYLAMRAFSVRVLTFSIGFGPRLFGWRNAAGTDFIVSAVPLGGYVKPLDCRDAEPPLAASADEFSGKPAWQRVIVYAAGPAANLILALLLYWLVLLPGETVRAPVLGDVAADTAAARAGLQPGDEITAINGVATPGWRALGSALMRYAGEDRSVSLAVIDSSGAARELQLSLGRWAPDPEASPFTALGLQAQVPPAVVGDVLAGSAAERAGLQAGDRILAMAGTPVADWSAWVEQVRASPGQRLALEVQRGERQLRLVLTPEAVQQGEQTLGRAGVAMAGMRQLDYGVGGALAEAGRRVLAQTGMILASIGKLFSGELSVKTLGGPLTIAQVAGDTAAVGLSTFMLFLAFFSISLGVINLLPIPMLDGGWIVFGLLEMLSGRPLPERFLLAAQQLGMTLVFGLMLLAVFNDVMRHLV